MIKLKKKIYTYYSFLIFLICALFVAIPVVTFYRLVWPNDESRKLQIHNLICNYFRWCSRHIPEVSFSIENPFMEDFVKPSIIISNHQSQLDLLCILMLYPKIVAITNKWVWNFPLFAPIIRYLEFYPTIEGMETCEEGILSLLERGYSVLVFPEGTRSENCDILRFHKGAFYLAEKSKSDILPIYLDGPGRILPKNDFTLNPGSINIEVGKRVLFGDNTMGNTSQEQCKIWRQHYMKRKQQSDNKA